MKLTDTMKNKKCRIPGYVKAVLWSYKINELDLIEDREEIITRVLNYGDWEMVRWLFKTFGENEIKNVILHFRRGRWFEKVLNFWLTIFDIKPDEEILRKAVMDIRVK